jgi:hypothetical protein
VRLKKEAVMENSLEYYQAFSRVGKGFFVTLTEVGEHVEQ